MVWSRKFTSIRRWWGRCFLWHRLLFTNIPVLKLIDWNWLKLSKKYMCIIRLNLFLENQFLKGYHLKLLTFIIGQIDGQWADVYLYICIYMYIYRGQIVHMKYASQLTYFSPVSHCHTPWKCQKTKGFLTFSGGIEMWHWTKMG